MANFTINLTGGSGGSGSRGGSGGQGVPYALDPNTGHSLTPAYLHAFPHRVTGQFKQFGGQAGGAVGSLAGNVMGGAGGAIAGQQLGSLAGGGIGKMMAGALGAEFGGAAAAIAPFLAPLAAAAIAAGVAVKAFTSTVEYFVERGKALSPFSGQISAARARADVRSTMMNIREAGELGGGISQLTDAQSRMDDSLREMLMPIKRFVVEKLAAVMEVLAKFMEEHGGEVTAILEAILTGIDVMIDIGNWDWSKIGEDMAKGAERVNKARDRSHDHINMLYGLFGGGDLDAALNHMVNDDPQKVQAQQRNANPVFGGL